MPEQPAGEEGNRGRDLPGAEAIGEVRALTEETAQRLARLFESSRPIRSIRGSQLASGFVGAIGFALFVVGIEHAADDIPVLDNAWGSITIGLLLLAAAGALLRRLAQ